MTIATVTADRADLVGDLERLGREHAEEAAPLQENLEAAQAKLEEARREVDAALAVLETARAAVTEASLRATAQRQAVEAELRRNSTGVDRCVRDMVPGTNRETGGNATHKA